MKIEYDCAGEECRVICRLQESEEINQALWMAIQRGDYPQLLPMEGSEDRNGKYFIYKIDGMTVLNAYKDMHRKREVERVERDMREELEELQSFGMPLSSLLTDEQHIYVSDKTKEIYFLCIPIIQGGKRTNGAPVERKIPLTPPKPPVYDNDPEKGGTDFGLGKDILKRKKKVQSEEFMSKKENSRVFGYDEYSGIRIPKETTEREKERPGIEKSNHNSLFMQPESTEQSPFMQDQNKPLYSKPLYNTNNIETGPENFRMSDMEKDYSNGRNNQWIEKKRTGESGLNKGEPPILPEIRKTEMGQSTIDLKVETEYSSDSTILLKKPSSGQMKKKEERVHAVLIRRKNGQIYIVNKSPFLIGRALTEVDMVVDNNPAISGIHCKIISENGKYYILDNYSTNGTFVNGIQVDAAEWGKLGEKSELTIADENFVFEVK